MDERLKLRRQHHVHEYERKEEREAEVITRATKLFRSSGQSRGISRIDLYLLRKLIHLLDDCGLRATRPDVGQQHHLPLSIQAIDRRRTRPLVDAHQVVET